MKIKFFLVLFLCYAGFSCSQVPITGRRQFKLMPASTLNSMSLVNYKEFLSTHPLSTNESQNQMVKRIGGNIADAVTRYFKATGKSRLLSGYKWEFNLVEDKTANAWCMPGGKVVVYTGLLGITQNEAALAVVMGHEITHAVAHHGNERMSQGAIAQGLEIVGNIATANNEKYNTLFNNIFAPGAQIAVLLPNSRNQEYEADHFGLNFAAMAGYNPNEAIPFWQRMAAASNGQKPPEFLSTHPADENRIARLKEFMPEALSYYKPAGK